MSAGNVNKRARCPEELTLFEGFEPDDPFEHWVGMPEYQHEDLSPWRSYPIHFRSEEALDEFCRLLGLDARPSKAFWWPPDPIGRTSGKVYKAPDAPAPAEEQQ